MISLNKKIPSFLIIVIAVGMFVTVGCGGSGGGDQLSGTGGGTPLGEIPVTVTGNVNGGNIAGAAPDRLAAPLAGYAVRAKNATTGETLVGAEALTDVSGNFVLSFRIPLNQDVSIVLAAQSPQDAIGTTIMRCIMPLSASDIITLINQYQGHPVLTIGDLSPSSEQLVKNVEQDLGLTSGSLGKGPAGKTATQINTEANKGGRFVLIGVTIAVQGKVTDGTGGTVFSVTRESTGSAGVQGDNVSTNGALSSDGKFVTFESLAANLVTGDTNLMNDIFVKNRQTGSTIRASVGVGGAEPDGDSAFPAISDDGRFVVFESEATNLVEIDTNVVSDIFVRDLVLNKTVRVSVSTGGDQASAASYGPSISANGRYVVFASDAADLVAGDTNLFTDIFLHDRDADSDGVFDEAGGISTIRISGGSGAQEADANSFSASISADGRYIAFDSDATNLVLDDLNNFTDIFVFDRVTGQTIRVSNGLNSVNANGNSIFPSISANGRFVAFESDAANLVAGDTNLVTDVFLYDRNVDGNGFFDEPGGVSMTRVSVGPNGAQANGDSNIGGLFSGANFALSGDGKVIVFSSDSTNLVANDTNGFMDIFVYDAITQTTSLLSKNASGVQADDESAQVAVSRDGTTFVFSSVATNLVDNDINAVEDVFVAINP